MNAPLLGHAVEGGLQKIRRSSCNVQQASFARGLAVHACRGHEMAQVIKLEVIPILKRFAASLAVAGAHEDLGVQVAVRALRLRDRRHSLVYRGTKAWVRCDNERGTGCLQPFVEFSVVKGRPAITALFQACSDAEVLEVVTPVRSRHHAPHRWDGLCSTDLETLGPESVGPACFV